MKNIIITGATGFIGSNLVKKLLKGDNNLYVVVRKNSKNLNKLPHSNRIQIIELDLNEMDMLSSSIGVSCDVFYHLAWDGVRGEARNDKELQKSNYINSMTALMEAKKMNCKQFVNSGSQAEYGVYNGKITEETPCKPVTEYGRYKYKFYLDAMEICKQEEISFREARIFSLYGPDDYEKTLVIDAINKMVNNEECSFTEATHTWDYLYIDDAIYALIKLGLAECESGAYNLANGQVKPLKEFILLMHKVSKSKSKLNFGVVPYPETGGIGINPDTTKIRNTLNWSPRVKFEEGIERIINKRNI